MTTISEVFLRNATPHLLENTIPSHEAALEISNFLVDPGLATNRFGITEFSPSQARASAVAFARLGGVLALLNLAPAEGKYNYADPNAVKRTAGFMKEMMLRSGEFGEATPKAEDAVALRNEVLGRFVLVVEEAGEGRLSGMKNDIIVREAPVISYEHEYVATRTIQRADRRGIAVARIILDSNYPRSFDGLINQHLYKPSSKIPRPRVSD